MLKGLKSVDLKIIQMYHFRLKWKRYTVCTNWWDSQLVWSKTPTFPSGTPTFCQMGVLNSCFQNPSESSELLDTTFWLKSISFGSNFFHLAKVLATTNSEPGLALKRTFQHT